MVAAIEKVQQNGNEIAPLAFSPEQVRILKNQIAYPEITDEELALFGQVCQRTGLDPFARQIYAVGRNQKTDKGWSKKMTIQVSIDGFRLQAERSGKYDGSETLWCGEDGQWVDVWLKTDPPKAAKTVVWRKGSDRPFSAVALWSDYVQTDKQGNPTSMWAKMSALMIGKCSEGLALRKGFPAELSGLYTREEMAQAENPQALPQQENPFIEQAHGIAQYAKENGLSSRQIQEVCRANNLPNTPGKFKTQRQVDTFASEIEDAISDNQPVEAVPIAPDDTTGLD